MANQDTYHYPDKMLSEALAHAEQNDTTILVKGQSPTLAQIATAKIQSVQSTQDTGESGRTVSVVLYPFEEKRDSVGDHGPA